MEKGLEHIIWKYFDAITKIPRISKHESEIVSWLVRFGEEHNLETEKDEVGNVLIRKQASPGYEGKRTVILQSHVDMVAAKNPASSHDFLTDPITYVKEGNWIKAKGTTLGADDGIGVAAALAVLTDPTLQHPKLECLFTVDEESGMTGANNLREDWLEGKILINMDSEDEGELFIGCAGGMDTTAVFKKNTQPVPEEVVALKIILTGLTGGHSGDEIHKGYANAIKLVVRLLWLLDKETSLYLTALEGGTLRNAIPPEASATIAVEKSQVDKVYRMFAEYKETIAWQYHLTDPGMQFDLEETSVPSRAFTADLKRRVILSLYSCPHGVYAWSKTMPGLVETSTNMALVRCEEARITMGTNQRSAIEAAKDDISDMVASTFLLAGAEVTQEGNYPGWEPDPDSEILKITKEAYVRLFDKEPAVKAIHAGLECGLFLEKYPELDMISFGPTIKGAHTPEERLDINTTQKFWGLLVEVLKQVH